MYYDCCVALPRGVMGLSAVCVCGFYLIILTIFDKNGWPSLYPNNKRPAFVVCECLVAITFLSSLDPGQALQSAVHDLGPHCVISKCVSNYINLVTLFFVLSSLIVYYYYHYY